jgi:hypothetical protein
MERLVIKDPFEKYDHMEGTKDFKEFLSWLSDEEREIAIERNRRFMEEPGGPYDYDAIFAKIPQENIKEYLRGWGLLPKEQRERVASGVSQDGSDSEGV